MGGLDFHVLSHGSVQIMGYGTINRNIVVQSLVSSAPK